MTAVQGRTDPGEQRQRVGERLDHRPWSWQQYLAVVGVVFLAWEAWTYIAWLGAGPAAIIQFRDRHVGAWAAARVYEAVAVVIAIVVLTVVVRQCRRQRRLTFDAMLCIAGISALWLDPVANFYQPVYLQSSNWINVGNWCSHMPLVVNRQCGRVPEPIVFMGLLYLVGFVLAGAAIGAVMSRLQRRFPGMSVAKLVFCACGVALLVDVLVEYPPMYLHLWNYPGSPNSLSLFDPTRKYPITLAIGAIIGWGSVGILRYFKDDRGRTAVERGVRLSGRTRTVVSVLATIAFMNIVVLTVDVALMLGGPYSSPWRNLPHHLVNAVCDPPDRIIVHTVYGPCPGNPGYRLPGRSAPGPIPPP